MKNAKKNSETIARTFMNCAKLNKYFLHDSFYPLFNA